MSNLTYLQLRQNKSYAEGRKARADGLASSANPFPDGLPVDQDAWNAGYEAADGTVDDTAYSGTTGQPAPTLLRSATTGDDPDDSWTKDQIKAWLDAYSIPYSAGDTKLELLLLAKNPPPLA